MKKLLILSFIFLTVIGHAQEQDKEKNKDWESAGEIKDVEIEIRKDRQIILPRANRLFEKIPPRPVEPAKSVFAYDFKAFHFNTPELNPVLRPLKLKGEEPSETYRGYVSAGYGNYASPYLEAFITSKQDKKKLIGAHAFFNKSGKGSVDGKNSAGGTSGITAFAQTFSKDLSFNGNMGYQNRSTHFYGYPEGTAVMRDTIKQAYSLFNLGLALANARNTDFAYQVGGDFSHLNDQFKAAETTVGFNFKGSYKVGDDQSVFIGGEYFVFNRKDENVEAKARNLFQANGYYSFFPVEKLKLQVGGIIALENDTLDSKSFHFYPDVKVTYPISDAVDFVGSLSGGMEKVSLQTLSNENLWLAPAIALSHTNKVIDLQAGLRAKAGSNWLLGAGISFATLKNLYFFKNAESDTSKFIVEYDNGAVKRFNFYASLLYTYADIARISLQGDYFGYNTDELSDAWHKPGYRVTLGASYNLFKKLVFTMDVIAQGNTKAYDLKAEETITLPAAFDLNFRTEYLFSDKFSAFVDLNNITSNKYQVFLNYPVRGFQATAGLTLKF